MDVNAIAGEVAVSRAVPEELGQISQVVASIIRPFVGGGEKGCQFGGRKGASCGVTRWPFLLVLRAPLRRLFCG